MKKRMISMVMTAVMTLTLVVAAAPVVANATAAAVGGGSTAVTYNHDVTGLADWKLDIPASYTFDGPSITNITATLQSQTTGGTYTGNAIVDVEVKSAGGYLLTTTDAALPALPYTVEYAGHDDSKAVQAYKGDTSTGTAPLAVGVLQKDDTPAAGLDKLTAEATIDSITDAESGYSYTDTLQFICKER